jgi:PAS domain S-box-containing protein
LATRWRLAAELVGLHAWSWDVAFGRVCPDGELERFLGLPPGGFGGTYEALLQCIHPSDRARVSEAIRLALEQHGVYELEFRVLRPEGGFRWVHEKGQFRSDEPGQPARLDCVALDVTDRKLAEAGLQTQHTLAQTLPGAATLPEAATRVLETVGVGLNWELGVFWLVDRSAWVLRCAATWHDPEHGLADFLSVCRRLAPIHGEALPGRVWQSGGPFWVEDVTADPPSARTAVALRLGLRAAVAFPVLGGG